MTTAGQFFASGRVTRSGSDLARTLAVRLPPHPLTRFAPAPTGALHLGHVVNAVYVWGLAAALGGRVLLRIEDHDRQRARAEAESLMLDDLDWLGFAPDIHPTDAYRRGACEGRQSERDAIYRYGARASLCGWACLRMPLHQSGSGRRGRPRHRF